MPYKTEFNKTHEVIDVIFSGRITEQDLVAATQSAINLGKVFSTNLYLIDTHDPEPHFSLVNIYNLPKEHYTPRRNYPEPPVSQSSCPRRKTCVKLSVFTKPCVRTEAGLS